MKNLSTGYRLILIIASLVVFIGGNLTTHLVLPWIILPTIISTALLYNFPLNLADLEMTLIQIVTLGSGLVLGPVIAGWGAVLGITLGYIMQQVRRGAFSSSGLQFKPVRFEAAFQLNLQLLPVFLALILTGWQRGMAYDPELSAHIWPQAVAPILLFGLFHLTLFTIAQGLDQQEAAHSAFYKLTINGLVEVLPLPLIFIILLTFPQIEALCLIALVSITCLVAVFINRSNATLIDLKRRNKDLTTLDQMSKALQSAQDLELDRLAAALNSIGEGILMMDTDGRIMLANEFILNITGLPRSEITNRRLCDLQEITLKTLGYTLEEAQSLMTGIETHTPKKTIQVSTARIEKVLERTTAPVLGQADQTIGWMISLRDVTEEHELDQSREMINSALIHDLRSPVGAVLSSLEIVNAALPAERQEMVDQGLRVARNGATRVLGLVDSLLDIACMQAGKMDLILNPLNIGTLIVNSLDELQPMASEYKITLSYKIADELPEVLADQSKISRVLNNLIDNALKFTPNGGDIAVSAESNGHNEVTIRVSDTGPGIPEKYRDKIFERFTTIPEQRSRRRGSGLGLTFCKMAVEAHGGRMWFEEPSGKASGSVFVFTLPCYRLAETNSL